MQKVRLYHDMLDAKLDMEKHIEAGWRVHSCAMGCYMAGYHPYADLIVVYEK